MLTTKPNIIHALNQLIYGYRNLRLCLSGTLNLQFNNSRIIYGIQVLTKQNQNKKEENEEKGKHQTRTVFV